MAEIEREYAVSDVVKFPLIDFGGTDFENTPVTFAAGDVQLSKDDGAFVNTTNLPTHKGNGFYKLILTAAELTAATVDITVIDQTGPKAWEDQGVVVATYGNAAAQHAFNRNLAVQLVSLSATGKTDVNAEVVDVMTTDTITELAQAQPPTAPTIVQALMLSYMALRNKLTSTSSTQSIRNDAGTVITKAALSDSSGTFTRDKLVTGP